MAADYHELKEVRYRYSRHIDAMEWERMAAQFTEDAVCRYEGFGEYEGRDEIAAFGREELEPSVEYSRHEASMPVLDVDGDEATGNWYLNVFYVFTDGSAGWRHGHYNDEYRRVDGEWKISRQDTDMRADASAMFAGRMAYSEKYDKDMAVFSLP